MSADAGPTSTLNAASAAAGYREGAGSESGVSRILVAALVSGGFTDLAFFAANGHPRAADAGGLPFGPCGIPPLSSSAGGAGKSSSAPAHTGASGGGAHDDDGDGEGPHAWMTKPWSGWYSDAGGRRRATFPVGFRASLAISRGRWDHALWALLAEDPPLAEAVARVSKRPLAMTPATGSTAHSAVAGDGDAAPDEEEEEEEEESYVGVGGVMHFISAHSQRHATTSGASAGASSSSASAALDDELLDLTGAAPPSGGGSSSTVSHITGVRLPPPDSALSARLSAFGHAALAAGYGKVALLAFDIAGDASGVMRALLRDSVRHLQLGQGGDAVRQLQLGPGGDADRASGGGGGHAPHLQLGAGGAAGAGALQLGIDAALGGLSSGSLDRAPALALLSALVRTGAAVRTAAALAAAAAAAAAAAVVDHTQNSSSSKKAARKHRSDSDDTEDDADDSSDNNDDDDGDEAIASPNAQLQLATQKRPLASLSLLDSVRFGRTYAAMALNRPIRQSADALLRCNHDIGQIARPLLLLLPPPPPLRDTNYDSAPPTASTSTYVGMAHSPFLPLLDGSIQALADAATAAAAAAAVAVSAAGDGVGGASSRSPVNAAGCSQLQLAMAPAQLQLVHCAVVDARLLLSGGTLHPPPSPALPFSPTSGHAAPALDSLQRWLGSVAPAPAQQPWSASSASAGGGSAAGGDGDDDEEEEGEGGLLGALSSTSTSASAAMDPLTRALISSRGKRKLKPLTRGAEDAVVGYWRFEKSGDEEAGEKARERELRRVGLWGVKASPADTAAGLWGMAQVPTPAQLQLASLEHLSPWPFPVPDLSKSGADGVLFDGRLLRALLFGPAGSDPKLKLSGALGVYASAGLSSTCDAPFDGGDPAKVKPPRVFVGGAHLSGAGLLPPSASAAAAAGASASGLLLAPLPPLVPWPTQSAQQLQTAERSDKTTSSSSGVLVSFTGSSTGSGGGNASGTSTELPFAASLGGPGFPLSLPIDRAVAGALCAAYRWGVGECCRMSFPLSQRGAARSGCVVVIVWHVTWHTCSCPRF